MSKKRSELFKSRSRTRSISRVLLVFVLAITLVVGSVPMTAQEVQAATLESGSTFTLTDDGTLTIKSVAFKFTDVSEANRDNVLHVIFTGGVKTIRPDMLHASNNPTYYDDYGGADSNYSARNCFRFVNKITIQSGVTTVLQKGFWKLQNLTSISIPASVDEIGEYAFQCCYKLKSITLPEKVTDISNYTFDCCYALTNVKLGTKTTSIGEYAFSSCEKLSTISLPASVKTIDYAAFYKSGLTGITLPGNLTSMGEYAFAECKSLSSITIPAKCKVVPNYAFNNDISMTSVKLNSGLTSIGAFAFNYCPITTVTFPSSLNSIGDRAFRSTNLRTIIFNGKTPVRNLHTHAFNNVNGAKGYYPYGSDTNTLNMLKEKFTGRQNGEDSGWSNTYNPNIIWYNNAKIAISTATITGITNKTYTGKAITQRPTVKVGSKTLKNGTDYTLSYKNNVKVGTATVTITGKGNYTGSVNKTFKINPAATSLKANSITVGSVGNKTWTGSPIKPKVTVKNGSTTLKEGTDYTLSYKNNTAVGTATITITGKGKYKDTRTVNFKIVAPAKQIERVEGRNRYLTSIAIADELKESNGNKKFPAIIVATGTAHPDALAGGYLAKVKGAPIILTTPSIESDTIRYIKTNMASNGRVYILGGELAIPNSFVTKLRSAGITNYKRLGGKSRFDTNLLILNEAGVKKGEEIVVAKGYGSAQTDAQDALIAASTGRPMLLVGQGDLTPSQKNFLNNKRPKTMTIIGSTATVSSRTAEQLGNYGTIPRIAGENIYDRSVKVGEKYYKAPKCVVLAIGDNWPDALTGGPLAVKKGGPLLLVGTSYNQYKYAKAYVKRANIYKNYTLGGTAAVPEATTREIMKR